MYCANCGVRLNDTEKKCPLCGTTVYHPDILRGEGEALYPDNNHLSEKGSVWFGQLITTVVFLLGIFVVLLCDWQFNDAITWSGYAVGGMVNVYVSFILPAWFKNPNPVIFVPCSFAAVGLYLMYINLMAQTDWFLSFAFPVTGGVGIIVTAVVALFRYVRRGKLYILGAASIALGGFMLLVEFLLDLTFGIERFIWWSLYPLVTLVLLGLFFIFLNIYRPARETMERKFFI